MAYDSMAVTLDNMRHGFRPVTPENARPAYADAVAAKLKRDRESYEEFRAIDQEIYERAVRRQRESNLAAAEEDVPLFTETVTELEAGVTEARKELQAAQARAATALRNAEKRLHEWEVARDSEASPGEIDDAAVRMTQARKTAEQRAAPLEGLRKQLSDAEADLAFERQGLADAEKALQAAQQMMKAPPGTAPLSEMTVKVNAWYMQSDDEVWDSIGYEGRTMVRDAIHARPRTEEDDAIIAARFNAAVARRAV
jgi:hypothetical protein